MEIPSLFDMATLAIELNLVKSEQKEAKRLAELRYRKNYSDICRIAALIVRVNKARVLYDYVDYASIDHIWIFLLKKDLRKLLPQIAAEISDKTTFKVTEQHVKNLVYCDTWLSMVLVSMGVFDNELKFEDVRLFHTKSDERYKVFDALIARNPKHRDVIRISALCLREIETLKRYNTERLHINVRRYHELICVKNIPDHMCNYYYKMPQEGQRLHGIIMW